MLLYELNWGYIEGYILKTEFFHAQNYYCNVPSLHIIILYLALIMNGVYISFGFRLLLLFIFVQIRRHLIVYSIVCHKLYIPPFQIKMFVISYNWASDCKTNLNPPPPHPVVDVIYEQPLLFNIKMLLRINKINW